MDVLIVEPLEAEVIRWLNERHSVQYAPELSQDPRAFRQALYNVHALIVPPSVAIDAAVLQAAPSLRAVGRVSAGVENIDIEACNAANVEVVRSLTASASAEAEFMLGALLTMLRRVPVQGSDGLRVGRELGAATVGLVGLQPSARSMSNLLLSFGSRVLGYDPALHASDGLWARWQIEPSGLRELMEQADAVCVMLPYFTRYRGIFGERVLPVAKVNQVIVSISHSALFDDVALADVLSSGRVAAAWLDSVEPGLLDDGRALHGQPAVQVTPRLASTTLESRVRSAWAVARRIDEMIGADAATARDPALSASRSDGTPDPAGEPVPT